jgi:hypothetical protein
LVISFTAAFVATLIYGSFFEWAFHRYFMHLPTFGITHFFKGHAKVHHRIYQGDLTYAVGDRDPEEVTLAWWAMPILPLAHMPIMIGLYFQFGMSAAVGMFTACIFYQTAYEYLHYCMHVPQGRIIEVLPFYRWLNDHHLQHHRKHFTNLNVFIPIADYVFGTRRSCARPNAAMIVEKVGLLPDHRRPSKLDLPRKVWSETWTATRQLQKRLFGQTRAAGI